MRLSNERRFASGMFEGGVKSEAMCLGGRKCAASQEPLGIILWPGRQAAAIMPCGLLPFCVPGASMKKLLTIAIVLGLAVVLILTKPTPQEIASAATGQMNYVVFNKNKMPREFVAAAGAAAVLQTVQDIFSGGRAPGAEAPVRWQTRDLVFLATSDLTLAHFGSLKCAWLLRNGFCIYFSE
jgi:hypothetical protein